jgi:putative intracellular protease/amidase
MSRCALSTVEPEVVVDRGLITSRRPADLDAFIEAMLEQIAVAASTGELA